MTVKELNREQLDELKQAYIVETAVQRGEGVAWSELADAVNVPDEEVFTYYAGVDFSNDDFSCTIE